MRRCRTRRARRLPEGRAAVAATLLCGLLAGVLGGVAPAGASSQSAWPIGLICSCTGPEASSTGTSAPALEAWASAVNAAGGIGGHKVNLIVKDDTTNPGTALAEAEALVGQDHVVAIFDNSDVDSAFEAYVSEHHVPVVGSYADSTPMYTNADFFTNGTTINWLPAEIIYMMKRVHSTKLADFYCAEVAICAQLVPVLHGALAKAGLQLNYAAAIEAAAPNYAAPCVAAKQTGATSMDVGDASAIVVKVATDCKNQGYTPVQFGLDGTVAESWRTTPAMDGNIDVQPDVPFFVHSTPATKAMYAALKKYQPSLLSSPNFGEVVVEAWASGKLFEAAAEAGHLGANPTPAQVIRGLYALHGVTLGGLTPPLTFVRNAPTPGIACVFLMGIRNGQWTLPNGLKTVCPK